ncbi:methyl-accepting chemotaxis protein [Alteromonas antoniana]|uniref:methyl-accepting chemotaxis protein n=1 Tax=Alteromonas antoniana TaxID=2803813 RepID=UPI001C485644|nr:methyl-accepting chemotaxis protein [Alteromonas antoniana]
MNQRLSLTVKLMSVVGALFVLLALVFITVSYFLLDDAEQDINRHISEEVTSQIEATMSAKASQYAAQTQTLMGTAHQVPYNLAAALAASIEASDSNSLTREQTERMVRSLLAAGSTSSMYAQFEANQFDGNASAFSGGASHSVPGRGSFEVYFVREQNGAIQQIPIDDADEKYDATLDEFGFRAAEWYLCNKDNMKPCVANPYNYEIREGYEELMTSLTVPVIANGRFRGVVGVDLNLPILQQRANDLKASLYNGEAEVYVISQNGMVAAATDATDKLARPFTEVFNDDSVSEKILSVSGKPESVQIDDMLYVTRPITLSLPQVDWQLVVGVNVNAALAPVATVEGLISSAINSLLTTQFVVAMITTLIALSLIYLFTRGIIQPVKQVADRMTVLAGQGGDLTQDIQVHSHAELIQLSQAFNLFKEKVRELLEQAKESCEQVIKQSEQTQSRAAATNEQIQVQQSEIDSVVTAITEMSQTAHDVARTASNAADNADTANKSVQQTEQEISHSTELVMELSGEMKDASKAVKAVSERSTDIKKILDVIGAIAEQTNLLALNAAIEAARAGENGRGFSVVADEVRSLASKTADSVGEISKVITALQSEVDNTVGIIEQGNTKAEQASSRTQEALQKMQETVLQIDEISQHMTQMAAAAEEQSQVSEELNRNMVVIGNATKEVSAISEASQESSEAISREVNTLSDLLSKLKTRR